MIGAYPPEEDSMYKHILIPTDGSELSRKAVQQGIALARSVKAKVKLLTVSPPFHPIAVAPSLVTATRTTYNGEAEKAARGVLEAAQAVASREEVPATAEHVFSDHPYEAIIEAARKNKCDLVFMASHGRRGLQALLIGSETQKVLTHSKLPVLVCR
jgi:nucleotide-binding universal stress UspA family protein